MNILLLKIILAMMFAGGMISCSVAPSLQTPFHAPIEVVEHLPTNVAIQHLQDVNMQYLQNVNMYDAPFYRKHPCEFSTIIVDLRRDSSFLERGGRFPYSNADFRITQSENRFIIRVHPRGKRFEGCFFIIPQKEMEKTNAALLSLGVQRQIN